MHLRLRVVRIGKTSQPRWAQVLSFVILTVAAGPAWKVAVSDEGGAVGDAPTFRLLSMKQKLIELGMTPAKNLQHFN